MKRMVLLAIAACSGGESPGPIVETDGRLCLFGTDPSGSSTFEQTFTEGQPVFVRFAIDQCLSSSCTRDESASCTVREAGAATFEVEGIATWIDVSGQNVACTDDCLLLGATCATPPLAAGSYVFANGPRSVTVTIPSVTAEPPCTP